MDIAKPIVIGVDLANGPDRVGYASSYVWHPSGIKCDEISNHLCENLGLAFSYVYRHLQGGQPVHDIKQALYHLRKEVNALFDELNSGGGGRYLVQPNFREVVIEKLDELIAHEEFAAGFGMPRMKPFLRHIRDSAAETRTEAQICRVTAAAGSLNFHLGDLAEKQAQEVPR